jgi:hypothetical protein
VPDLGFGPTGFAAAGCGDGAWRELSIGSATSAPTTRRGPFFMSGQDKMAQYAPKIGKGVICQREEHNQYD